MAGRGAFCQEMAKGWENGLLRWIVQAQITIADRTPWDPTSKLQFQVNVMCRVQKEGLMKTLSSLEGCSKCAILLFQN